MYEDLLRLLENGEPSRITVQITGEELMRLIRETAKELNELSAMKNGEDEDFLQKKEVMDILGVCDTTLWLWAKNNYLKPAKAGRKVLYRKSDVLRLLETKERGYVSVNRNHLAACSRWSQTDQPPRRP